MSADAVPNLTLTDSNVRLALAPTSFPYPRPAKTESKERTREMLTRTESASIPESIA
jgi:hypothetical protein